MPISTTFVTARAPSLAAPSSELASQTWPTISAVVRLRLNPWAPVEQNEQSIAQPTWLEMHSVPRPGSGMNTISIACSGVAVASADAAAFRSHLRVPSCEACSESTSGSRTSATAASRSRKPLARSVIAVKSATRRL